MSTWFRYLSQFAGSFLQSFFRVGFKYLWKTSSLPLLWGGKGQRIFYLFLVVEGLGPWGHFWTLPLSDRMYLEHMCTGKYWLIRVVTMVSVDLSGMEKASGHPVRWSIMVRMCLLPDVEVLQSVTKSIAILSNGLSGISVTCSGYYWNLAFSHLQRT